MPHSLLREASLTSSGYLEFLSGTERFVRGQVVQLSQLFHADAVSLADPQERFSFLDGVVLFFGRGCRFRRSRRLYFWFGGTRFLFFKRLYLLRKSVNPPKKSGVRARRADFSLELCELLFKAGHFLLQGGNLGLEKARIAAGGLPAEKIKDPCGKNQEEENPQQDPDGFAVVGFHSPSLRQGSADIRPSVVYLQLRIVLHESFSFEVLWMKHGLSTLSLYITKRAEKKYSLTWICNSDIGGTGVL